MVSVEIYWIMLAEYLSRCRMVNLSSPVEDSKALGLHGFQRGYISLEHAFAVIPGDFRMNAGLMPGPEEVSGFKQQSFAIPVCRNAFQY